MAEAAGSANGDDLNIKVGAEIDLDEATKATVKSYEDMAARLKDIATDAAKELSAQFEKVAKGIRDGEFNADALSQATAELDKAAASAELTDNAIEKMAQGLDRATKNSRSLADYMSGSNRQASLLEKGVGKVSSWLDGISPNAKKASDFLGGVAQKIPGVSSFMSKMPAVGGAIGVAFKAAVAAGEVAINAMREFRQMMRDAKERDISVSGENIRNTRANRTAALDLEVRRRREALEDERALMETQAEIDRLESEKELAEKVSGISNPMQREVVEMQARYAMENQKAALRDRILKQEEESNAAEKRENDKRIGIIDDTIKAEQERLEKMQGLQKEYQQYASERRRLAMERAKGEGLDLSDKGVMAKVDKWVSEDLRSWVSDKVRDSGVGRMVTGILGKGDYSTEEAQSLIERGEDAQRQQRQNLASLSQERAGLVEDGRRIDRNRQRLEKERTQWWREGDLRQANLKKEEEMRRRAVEESVAGRRMELAAAGNRLTAMGLGGGNVGADYGKDIATNTKEMVALQKETIRAFNRRGIAGDNSFNGPAIAPRARLGDMGMTWGM